MRLRSPWLDGVAITVVRFLIMLVTLEVASLAGVSGWTLGFVANIAVTVYAVVLVTQRGLWRRIGATTAWRSWAAVLLLLPLVAEAVAAALPAGLAAQDPGWLLWSATLLLVGVNEELISRGVILERAAAATTPVRAVAFTAALFGLQHLSRLALTSSSVEDTLLNVVASGVYGFALCAWQLRVRWIWPLVIVHAVADLTVIHAVQQLPLGLDVAVHVGLLLYGLALLRGHRDRPRQARERHSADATSGPSVRSALSSRRA